MLMFTKDCLTNEEAARIFVELHRFEVRVCGPLGSILEADVPLRGQARFLRRNSALFQDLYGFVLLRKPASRKSSTLRSRLSWSKTEPSLDPPEEVATTSLPPAIVVP